jgi:hypothetical protein
MVDSIAFIPFSSFSTGTFQKNLIFFYFGPNLERVGSCSKVESARLLKPGRPRPDQVRREAAPALRVGFGYRSYVVFAYGPYSTL